MPLHVRSIAINIAVVCFFILSLVGWASGLSPSVCCERATIGAVLAYIAGAWAVRAVNAVLIHAMIARQVGRQMNADSALNRKASHKDNRSRARN
ncbi:MAG TPA: hypothetical protein VMW24_14470 [Sedimentisphaerales bacterium]|jgi:hypothetical protein|nr:hypothetical protein [Sedimentisphaerales bacterium]